MMKAIKQLSTFTFAALLTVLGFFIWRKFSVVQQQLTYREVINYFVRNRPSLASKGVLLKKTDFGGAFLISQNFLDNKDQILMKSNGVPYGRDFRVTSIDDELREAFGNKDMIIFT